MAIDPGVYFGNVVITVLTVLTFFILVLVFLYMIWGREETTHPEAKPKPKPSSSPAKPASATERTK